MDENEPWTDLERFVLINSERKLLPTLAELMGRPLEEVTSKFDQLNAHLERQYSERAKDYMEMGLAEDEAFMKVVGELKIDFKKTREDKCK